MDSRAGTMKPELSDDKITIEFVGLPRKEDPTFQDLVQRESYFEPSRLQVASDQGS